MAKKPTVGVWLKEDDMARFEAVAAKSRHSNASTLRNMLEDYLSGNLVPAQIVKKAEDRRLVSTTVDEDFKKRLDDRVKADGTDIPKLVIQLLDSMEAL